MRNFLQDTQDAYEQKYGREICINFSLYAELWNKYIGQREKNPLKHYEIKGASKNFEQKYENMCFAHYGIFLDLADIRREIEKLRLNKYNSTEEKLEYWFLVRNIYSKMGDAIYKYFTFIGYVEKILDMKRIGFKEVAYLNEIKNKRDFIVHFSGLPFTQDERGFRKLPKTIYNGKRSFSISEISLQSESDWVEVEGKILDDLKEVEVAFNNCHKRILELFEKYKKFILIYPPSVEKMGGFSSSAVTTGFSGFSSCQK